MHALAVVFVTVLATSLAACSESTLTRKGTAAERTSMAEPREIDEVPVTVRSDEGGFEADESVSATGRELNVVGEVGSDAADVWRPESGDFILRDDQTGSLWNVRGQAFGGELEGAQLGQIAAYTVFWFSWSTAHDGGEVWNRDRPNSPGPIPSDASGECNVPCSQIRSGGPAPDGIPSLDHEGRWDRPKPAQMIKADQEDYLSDASLVMGVFLEGEARAYPHAILNWHENHIDQAGDVEYNMTYCPLTGSGILIPADQGGEEPLYFYVSGRLFNDNLTMFERGVSQTNATFWNQVLLRGISGPRAGEQLSILPLTETTWGRWKRMHPDTLVASDDTGYTRSYGSNPYVAQQQPNANSLTPISPQWESSYPNKSKVLALDGPRTSRAYAFNEMEEQGDRVVINDVLDDTPLIVVFEAEHRMAIPYRRSLGERLLTFEGTTAP